MVLIKGCLERGGIKYFVVHQPDSSFACLPAWMMQPSASRYEICDKPNFSLDILRSLRAQVDHLLGSWRTTTRADGGNTGLPIVPSNSDGAASKSSMTISAGRAVEQLAPGSIGCFPQFATSTSVPCLRSRRRVSPAMAATGTRLSSSVDWSARSSSTRMESLMSQVKHNARDNSSPRVLARSWGTGCIVQRRGRDLKTSVNKL